MIEYESQRDINLRQIAEMKARGIKWDTSPSDIHREVIGGGVESELRQIRRFLEREKYSHYFDGFFP